MVFACIISYKGEYYDRFNSFWDHCNLGGILLFDRFFLRVRFPPPLMPPYGSPWELMAGSWGLLFSRASLTGCPIISLGYFPTKMRYSPYWHITFSGIEWICIMGFDIMQYLLYSSWGFASPRSFLLPRRHFKTFRWVTFESFDEKRLAKRHVKFVAVWGH